MIRRRFLQAIAAVVAVPSVAKPKPEMPAYRVDPNVALRCWDDHDVHLEMHMRERYGISAGRMSDADYEAFYSGHQWDQAKR